MPLQSPLPRIGLLVIRSDDMERLAAFYEALGFRFVRHSHPPCGEHFAATDSSCVFEIYQRKADQQATAGLFFGLNVSSVDEAIESAVTSGGSVVRFPEDTQWGRSAIIRDPDGHRVMLMECGSEP